VISKKRYHKKRWRKKNMNEKKPTPSTGKIKIIIGSFSLGIVFLTPYLNITQFSLSMNLLQTAIYSLLFLSFWVIAAYLLRKPHPTQKTYSFPKRNTPNYLKEKTITTL